MRAIKFRVWDNVDYMSTPFTLQDLQLKKVQFAEDCIVEQFTGLLDAKKNEVYEGDIMKSIKDERLFNWLVMFENGCFGIKNIGVDGFMGDFWHTNSEYFFYDHVVIGNIHSNLELL